MYPSFFRSAFCIVRSRSEIIVFMLIKPPPEGWVTAVTKTHTKEVYPSLLLNYMLNGSPLMPCDNTRTRYSAKEAQIQDTVR